MKSRTTLPALTLLLIALLFTACAPTSVSDVEQSQQEAGNMAIIQNQPVPDLGGYSFERQIVIETYLARNRTISTYAYIMTYDGRFIEICPSIGYPIPYSTQLTNPERVERYSAAIVLPNAEPNSLYPPESAAATLVQCVNPDGSVSPVYVEENVQAFPFRIVSDIQLQRAGEPSFSVPIK